MLTLLVYGRLMGTVITVMEMDYSHQTTAALSEGRRVLVIVPCSQSGFGRWGAAQPGEMGSGRAGGCRDAREVLEDAMSKMETE